GRVLDRREFFWENLPELEPRGLKPDEVGMANGTAKAVPSPTTAAQVSGSGEAGQRPAATQGVHFHPGEFFSALLKKLYIGQPYVPPNIYVPVQFEDREMLEDLLSDQIAGEGARATRVHIVVPQRGDKRSLLD